MIVNFDFHLPRFLAQRFPPLHKAPEVGLSSNNPNGIYHWPGERPGWELNEQERDQLRASLVPKPPPLELDENATIADALSALDEWSTTTLRAGSPLPARAQALLCQWLDDQWRLYTTRSLPEAYLWEFIKTLSDGGAVFDTTRACIPPLIGQVEVLAYQELIQHDSEGAPEIECNWLNEAAPAHLCDRLADVFRVRAPQYDERGDEVCDTDGRLVMEDKLAQSAWLQVEFRSGGIRREWLDRMSGFGYWPGASHPSEHWLLRRAEVQLPRAERTVSGTLPSSLARSIARKSPKAYNVMARAASVITDAESDLLPPLWMDDGFLLAAWDWAWDQAFPMTRGGKRRYSLRGACFLAEDNPRDIRFRTLMREFRRNVEVQKSSGAFVEWTATDNINFGHFFENWEIAALFAGEAAAAKLQAQREWRQEIFELHRAVTETLETLARRRFREDGFAPVEQWKDRQGKICTREIREISKLFSQWYETAHPSAKEALICGDGRRGPWGFAFQHDCIEPRLRDTGTIGRNIMALGDLITAAVNQARVNGGRWAIPELGSKLADILVPVGAQPNAGWQSVQSWSRGLTRLASFATKATIGDVLLAGKIVLELRNLFTHGTIAIDQPFENKVVVVNSESNFCTTLDAHSLAICYRLLIVAASAVHNSASPAIDWVLRNLLTEYADRTPKVIAVEYPRIYWADAQEETVACLCKQRTAKSPQLHNEDKDDDWRLRQVPDLVAEIAVSSVNYDLQGKENAYRALGVQELLVVFPDEGQCQWSVLGAQPTRQLSPDSHGVVTSQVFPTLRLDLRALSVGTSVKRH